MSGSEPQAGAAAAPTLVEALRVVMGADYVRDDAATLTRYAQSTSTDSSQPLAVAYPGCSDDVVAVLKLAARHGIAVYPVSTGKNWGYGDACAVGDGQLIVELSRMNRIIAVDPTLAYAIIEPGVTQRQLSDYLRDNHIDLWIDCTGAGPDTSLVGNVLERGFGHSPYGNRLQHVCGMHVVLADGELLKTGFGHYPLARAANVFPYGIGPFLDGIFTQSNFGIVTCLGLWLMPKCETVNHFICSVDEHVDIALVVDALRPLRLDGTLRSVVHIGNDLRLISGGQVYPRDAAKGAVPLPPALRLAMRRAAGVGAWTVSGALYGSALQVAAARSALKRALRPTPARTLFLTERRLALGALAARWLHGTEIGKKLGAKVALGKALFGMNRGIPDGRFLAGAYWRRRGGLPPNFPDKADPAADRCGMLWVSPIIPMLGEHLLALVAMVEPVFERFGFDLFITFSMINERSLGGVITVAFDKDDVIEAERAHACYRALFDMLMDAGYVPYRVGIGAMARLDPHGDAFWRTAARIKDALDPAGILAPGRYEPRRAGGRAAGASAADSD